MGTGEEPLERVLAQLDRWRHLPKYRLEPRVDVLFGMTLATVIRSKFNTEGKLHVIPEFPIKTSGNDERTFNVDFAVLTHGGDRVFLVELKTDSNSIDPKQLCRMRERGLREFRCLLNDIRTVAKASPAKAKYLHLICELERAGTMEVGEKIKELGPRDLTGFSEAMKCLVAKNVTSRPELVLISPRRDINACTQAFHCIDFDEYANTITPSLEETFARYLREWQSEAGKKVPAWAHASPSPDS